MVKQAEEPFGRLRDDTGDPTQSNLLTCAADRFVRVHVVLASILSLSQDTVVALQALAVYAAFSGAVAIDLTLNVSAPASSFESLFSINSTTYLTLMSQEVTDLGGILRLGCAF